MKRRNLKSPVVKYSGSAYSVMSPHQCNGKNLAGTADQSAAAANRLSDNANGSITGRRNASAG